MVCERESFQEVTWVRALAIVIVCESDEVKSNPGGMKSRDESMVVIVTVVEEVEPEYCHTIHASIVKNLLPPDQVVVVILAEVKL